ncbi:MAG: hypothetical protein JWO57_4035 [Pseudonocardiales bacterium]|nr:hypothetical protein [Pseudonocardiales bacterium]
MRTAPCRHGQWSFSLPEGWKPRYRLAGALRRHGPTPTANVNAALPSAVTLAYLLSGLASPTGVCPSGVALACSLMRSVGVR